MSVDDRSKQNLTRVSNFKTRKSDLISGLSLVTVLSLWATFRNISKDINELVEEKTRATEQRIERIESALKDIILLERASRKEDIAELKQRVIWIEREIGTFRKK